MPRKIKPPIASDQTLFRRWRKWAVTGCSLAPSFCCEEIHKWELFFHAQGETVDWVTAYADANNRPTLKFKIEDLWLVALVPPEAGALLILPNLITLIDSWAPNFLQLDVDPNRAFWWKTIVSSEISLMAIGFENFCSGQKYNLIINLIEQDSKNILIELLNLVIPRLWYLNCNIDLKSIIGFRESLFKEQADISDISNPKSQRQY
jgi:hypothetical protein